MATERSRISLIKLSLWLIGATALSMIGLRAAADNSSGKRTIYVTKTASVRISNLSDIVFPTDAFAPSPQEISVCVFSNSGAAFHVIGTSANAGSGKMNLRAGGRDINYVAEWIPDKGASVTLVSGVATPPLTGADQSSPTCGSGTNARLRISLDPVSYSQVPSGNYSDTLSLTITPN